jgi:hypothetical protein
MRDWRHALAHHTHARAVPPERGRSADHDFCGALEKRPIGFVPVRVQARYQFGSKLLATNEF